MPFATGNTHPRFWGWVHGTGIPAAVGADMMASAMNSNCGGRDHGAVEIERSVIEWLIKLTGLPDSGFGITTSGTSQATILAMLVAQQRLFGADVRTKGIRNMPEVRVYCAEGAHSCVVRAVEVLGHGSDAVRKIPVDGATGKLDIALLKNAIAEDRARDLVPLAVVGTAGSVNLGIFDDLEDLGTFCAEENIFFHVDAAFGFWILLAHEPYRSLIKGIHLANSIACDFHKWLGVQYDCGACLIYDKELMKSTFNTRPSYLASQAAGIASGDLWFCDYGLELSRGFRSLKVWASIQAVGLKAFGETITDNCLQAQLLADLVEKSDYLELARPVVSNICCFWIKNEEMLPGTVAATLQLSGVAVFSTTIVDGRECMRAAIVNHRTQQDDIRFAVVEIEKIVAKK